MRGSGGAPMCPPPCGRKKDLRSPKKRLVDDEDAEAPQDLPTVHRGGAETTARLLRENGIPAPAQYGRNEGGAGREKEPSTP